MVNMNNGDWTKEQAAAYLAAMIDGEGWIGEPKGPQNRAIRIANTDYELITAITQCCDVLGITYKTYDRAAKYSHWSPQRWVEIYGRDNMELVHRLVPIQSRKKRDRLTATVRSYMPRVDMEALNRLYDQGLTMREVAQEMGLSLKRVINAMNLHGVPRRAGTERAAVVWRVRRERAYARQQSRPID